MVFVDGQMRVIRRDNAEQTVVLGEQARVLDPERCTRVRIDSNGASIGVSLDGEIVLECEDASDARFSEGRIGFLANNLTRFRDVRVLASPEEAKALEDRRAKQQRELTALGERHPKPRLWKKIATPAWGTDRNLRMGDLDGDGQPEIVLARRTDRLGGDNFSTITSLAAYDLDGRQLWTIGEPDASPRHTTSDLCFQLHDLDGDGKAEVIFCRDWELFIADGATGRILRRAQLPKRLDADPAKPMRIFADSIYFCDLTGSGREDSILIKDRYNFLYALDRELKPLWSFAGKLGHYPFARDVDGDGKDEIIIGYHFLDHDGTCLWSAPYHDHADNVLIVNLDGGQPRVLMAASDAGFRMLDLEGRELLHYPLGHAQSLCVARLLPESEELQIVVNTFWGPVGITAVFDECGKLLREFEPMPYACLLQPVNWAPLTAGGIPSDLILLSTHPEEGGLIDGRGDRAVMFPDDGHPVLCSDARDVDGDGIDEVLTWDESELWIYKADVPGRTPDNYPRRNPWHNDSNYRAQFSLPRRDDSG